MKLIAPLVVMLALAVTACGSSSAPQSKLEQAEANLQASTRQVVGADRRAIIHMERLRRLEWQYEAEEAWGWLVGVRQTRIRYEKALERNSTVGELKDACQQDTHPSVFCERLR